MICAQRGLSNVLHKAVCNIYFRALDGLFVRYWERFRAGVRMWSADVVFKDCKAERYSWRSYGKSSTNTHQPSLQLICTQHKCKNNNLWSQGELCGLTVPLQTTVKCPEVSLYLCKGQNHNLSSLTSPGSKYSTIGSLEDWGAGWMDTLARNTSRKQDPFVPLLYSCSCFSCWKDMTMLHTIYKTKPNSKCRSERVRKV